MTKVINENKTGKFINADVIACMDTRRDQGKNKQFLWFPGGCEGLIAATIATVQKTKEIADLHGFRRNLILQAFDGRIQNHTHCDDPLNCKKCGHVNALISSPQEYGLCDTYKNILESFYDKRKAGISKQNITNKKPLSITQNNIRLTLYQLKGELNRKGDVYLDESKDLWPSKKTRTKEPSYKPHFVISNNEHAMSVYQVLADTANKLTYSTDIDGKEIKDTLLEHAIISKKNIGISGSLITKTA